MERRRPVKELFFCNCLHSLILQQKGFQKLHKLLLLFGNMYKIECDISQWTSVQQNSLEKSV